MQLQQPKPQLGPQQESQQLLKRGSEGLHLEKKSQPPTNKGETSLENNSLEKPALEPVNNSPHYKIQLCRESEQTHGIKANGHKVPLQGLKCLTRQQLKENQQLNHDDKHQSQTPKALQQQGPKSSCNGTPAQNSSVPSAKKQRPNFIALPKRSCPELPRTGQDEKRALHTKIIQRTVEQQQSRRVNKNPVTDDANGERDQINHILNGHVPPEQFSHSTNSKDDGTKLINSGPEIERSASEKPSKQPMTFFTKLSSKFLSPDTLNSPCDSLCSLDSTPWNMEGTETIVENPSKKTKAQIGPGTFETKPSTFEDREFDNLRAENTQLKAALEEAGRLNAQWRTYHQERQGHVDRLLATIHSLQQRPSSSSPPSAPSKTSDSSTAAPAEAEEVQRLKDALTRAKAEHQEHVTLLQMQVRAHRDDWEAESAEKRLERMAKEQAEARTALLLQEVHHLQQKLSEAEGVWSVCSRCGATPYPALAPSGGQVRKHLSSDHANISHGDRSQHLPFAAHGKQLLKPLSVNGQMKDLNGSESNRDAGHSGYIKQTSNNVQKQIQANAYNKLSSTNGLKEVSTYTPAAGPDSHLNQNVEQTSARIKQMEMLDPCLNLSYPSDCPPSATGVPTKPFSGNGYETTQQDAALGAPRLASASTVGNNIPLKGWIPVSMMHQIAFGGIGESKRLQYPHSYAVQAANNYMNGPNSYYQNYTSPSTSRESSLVSCTSSSENTTTVQSPGAAVNCLPQEKRGNEFGGARPKTSINRPMSLEDDQKKAKHRARNILANAIPISPVSSGPSTPAGVPPRAYAPPAVTLPQTQCPLSKPNSTNTIDKNVGVIDFSPVEKSSMTNAKEAPCDDISSLDINDNTSNENEMKVSSPTILTQKIAEITNHARENKTISNEFDEQEHKPTQTNSNDNKSANSTISNQISASTSNETSRSSSPGMSLTTFALTSEGRGIPGAICFSLHPDVKPCINKGVLTSPEPTSPKKELSVSSVHIEPKSPRPIPKSPIEISTKEHWWSVGEKEHFKYPEKAENVKNNGTLVNSTYVKLQDSGKKDNHSEIRTARAVSSQELAQQRKHSQEESTKVSAIKTTSGTNTTTFSFTPAVNSSTSSSNISSLDSSKACSPSLQPTTHLKSLASKNIASAIISYEIAAKGDHIVYADRLKPSDVVTKTKHLVTAVPEGVTTLSCKEIICPSCQMLFARDQHLLFLDHFETCKGPEFADL